MTPRLDPDLLQKMSEKKGKSIKYIREQVSKRAGKLSVSSLAAQLSWAKELRIGTAHALRRAGAGVSAEMRTVSATVRAMPASPRQPTRSSSRQKSRPLSAAVDFLIEDDELRGRCRNLILARSYHDRVLREATTVLEDRIKKLSGITNVTAAPLI